MAFGVYPTILAFDPIQVGIVVLALIIGFIQFIREKIATARAEREMREEIRRRGQQRSAQNDSAREPTPPAPKEGILEQLKRTLAETSRTSSPLPSPGTPPRQVLPLPRPQPPPPVSRDVAPDRPPSPIVVAEAQPMRLEEAAAYQVESVSSEDGYLMDATSSRAKQRKSRRTTPPLLTDNKPSAQLFRRFSADPATLRTTFLAKEIFGPPKGLQDD